MDSYYVVARNIFDLKTRENMKNKYINFLDYIKFFRDNESEAQMFEDVGDVYLSAFVIYSLTIIWFHDVVKRPPHNKIELLDKTCVEIMHKGNIAKDSSDILDKMVELFDIYNCSCDDAYRFRDALKTVMREKGLMMVKD